MSGLGHRGGPGRGSSACTGMATSCSWSDALGCPTMMPDEQHTLVTIRSQHTIGASQSKLVSHACGKLSSSSAPKPNSPPLGAASQPAQQPMGRGAQSRRARESGCEIPGRSVSLC